MRAAAAREAGELAALVARWKALRQSGIRPLNEKLRAAHLPVLNEE